MSPYTAVDAIQYIPMVVFIVFVVLIFVFVFEVYEVGGRVRNPVEKQTITTPDDGENHPIPGKKPRSPSGR
jgi:hypothetical protein